MLLLAVALLSFAAKLSSNVLLLHDSNSAFATYITDVTPVGSPLLLCRALFILPFTFTTVVYFVTSTLRNKPGSEVLGAKFCIPFSVSCIFEAIHNILWTRSWMVSAFILICAASFCQYATLYEAYVGLYNLKGNTDGLEGSTIWCHRIFVQSSLIFDSAWNAVITILILVVVLCYGIGITSVQASIIGLMIFAIGLMIWFLIENLVIEKYVRFAGMEYIAISIALTSLLTSNRTGSSICHIALLSMMSLVLILLFLRMIAIICFESRRKSRNQLYRIVHL